MSRELFVQAQVNVFKDSDTSSGLATPASRTTSQSFARSYDRTYVMYRGEIVEQGRVERDVIAPKHRYTERLTASIPGSAA